MCDPSLTDTGGRSSEFPEELEPWREVDVTDVEEKMRGLKMEQEADFSEPEQVQLVQPVLAVGPSSALPSTSSTPSPAVDGSLYPLMVVLYLLLMVTRLPRMRRRRRRLVPRLLLQVLRKQ